MEKVAVVGGAGFIGSHLCRKLLSQQYSVVCIDSFITGSKHNIHDLTSHPHFQLLEHDITKGFEGKQEFLANVAAVFHLASPASPNAKSPRSYIAYPIETMLVNAVGTYNLLEQIKHTKTKFLFASTSEVYGDPAISPQTEDYFGNVNPHGVRSVYDEAKRYGEAMTFAYLRKFDADVRIVRIFNTYGPYMQKDDGRVVSNLITQAIANQPLTIYGDGSQTRSFCYIDDMVDVLIRAQFRDNTKGQVINVGNPGERSIKDIALLIKELTKSSSEIVYEPLPEDDPKQRKPSIEKAAQLLSWAPHVTLEDGLKKTIEYFRAE